MIYSRVLMLIFTIAICQSPLAGQSNFPVTFQIIDGKSGRPIEGASVAIKEIGFQSLKSREAGDVYFSEVPIGEIHYFVTKEGYNGIDGVMNVTIEGKDNTKRIVLSKIPNKEANSILITGEVVDENGDEVLDATIEIRAGKLKTKVNTDESGNYSIELDLDQIVYNVNDLNLEVKKGKCRKKDKFPIPKQNYVYKDYELSCVSTDAGNSFDNRDDYLANDEELIMDMGDWTFRIDKVTKLFNTVTVSFTVKSNERDKFLRLFGHGGPVGSVMYDDSGNVHLASSLRIGNQNILTYNDVRLITGVAMKGKISYSNVPKSVKKVALIKFSYNIANYGESFQFYSNELEFRDLIFKK